MKTLIITTDTEAAFFKRGQKLAKLADKGLRVPEQQIISFEDPGDVLSLLTTARLALFQAIHHAPGSITAISQRVQRDRSVVKRDIDALAKYGLVRIDDKPLAGHGRMKEVHTTAKRFRLEANLG